MRWLWLFILVGCASEKAAVPSDGPGQYRRHCATCHGVTGKPDATMMTRLGVRDLTAPEMRARITPALVEQQIRNGSQNKLMPAFAGALSDAQITAIAEYVASTTFLQR